MSGADILESSAGGSRLEIRDLHVSVDGKPILKGVSLTVEPGQRHAIMGPNGSGKTTLAYALAGHPGYEVTGGEVLLDGANVLEMEPDERARAGLFLAFQYPAEVPGVSNINFLRHAVNAVRGQPVSVFELQKEVQAAMRALGMGEDFTRRNLNEGFSGGEKKRNEILQLALLKPRYAILDETDSGLDIDAVQIVAKGVMELGRPDMGTIIITHYSRILRYIPPHFVHVMVDGRIVRSGGPQLAEELEQSGYEGFRVEPVETAS
ncbi:MAG: ABC transporter ATP-binding protein [Planctomycetota bacterium]|nr:MAG: ABC transporter ATP-binding protein [Planctomycetota bacterium]